MIRSGAIVLTGATGWVGRTVLQYLLENLPPLEFSQRVRAFASQFGSINFDNGRSIDVKPLIFLPEFAKRESIDYLLHAAFLTPDRCVEMGLDNYCEANRSITRLICASVSVSPATRVVLFSSGAAAMVSAAHPRLDPGTPLQIYGQLKLHEERILRASNPTFVLRIYGLTGRFLRDPQRYALGDFLCSAFRHESVVIKSLRKVVRGYVSASDLAALAWEWLQSSDEAPSAPLEAVAETIDLFNLAQMISSIYNLPSVHSSIDLAMLPDVYTASSQFFLSLLEYYGLKSASLEQQIRDTYSGIVMHYRR